MSNLPNRIGSLLFCDVCGNLLNLPGDEDTILCEQVRRPAEVPPSDPNVLDSAARRRLRACTRTR
jgi:hypothetical protein